MGTCESLDAMFFMSIHTIKYRYTIPMMHNSLDSVTSICLLYNYLVVLCQLYNVSIIRIIVHS